MFERKVLTLEREGCSESKLKEKGRRERFRRKWKMERGM